MKIPQVVSIAAVDAAIDGEFKKQGVRGMGFVKTAFTQAVTWNGWALRAIAARLT